MDFLKFSATQRQVLYLKHLGTWNSLGVGCGHCAEICFSVETSEDLNDLRLGASVQENV